MLTPDLKQQLQSLLAQVPGSVELAIAPGTDAASVELQQLATDLVALSDKLSLSEAPATGRAPLLTLRSPQRGTHIGFAGVPGGHEFTSLVLALLHSAGHPPKTDAAQLEQVRALEGDYHFEIYVSLSCQTCPDVVQALNTMAALNPAVKTVMIDGALHQDEIQARNILAVPTVYLNGKLFSQGRVGLADILRKLDTQGSAAASAALSLRDPFDMLIVGGGPAGASAAIYAARKGLRTGIVAENFGGQVLDTLGIENFISVKATEGPKLVASLEEHVRDYAVDVMQGQRAASVISPEQNGDLFQVRLDSGAVLQGRSVLVATGARWRQIGVPGEAEYKGRGVAYCPHCDGPLFKGKAVAVIGGGNSGIEAAIDLAGIVEHVTVLEYSPTLKADSILVAKARSLPNVRIVTQAQTIAIEGDGGKVTGL
ncbi:MAG TPA: alkyl hydroperoxide reductase subunit F, partial [Hyphomicrobiales bacterium]|nr:alkyl hydroperoxide reductase subunit F [Hyphomicrobiales bacterium]